jgi:HlyD family secretion protein
MKKILIIIGVIIVLAGGVMFFLQQHTSASKQVAEEFKFEVLTRGNLENLVSSTGTLSAVGTVEVGSQISGIVEKVYVDYNDRIKKGQLLAMVDKSLLDAAVRDAEASLAKNQAQINQAETEYQRKQKLFEEGYISEIDLLTAKTSMETARATGISAEIALKKAKTNLKYAEIRSPIDGTIIDRAVEAGQTIAASMSAPTLFTIAEDLATMEIEALVDESDIGQIKEDIPVRFTVQAYPDEEFTGTVRQIRLNPTTVQDVVNYTVIVTAPNERGLLLPGMTATVDFLVEERKDVLLVPNTALYFQPPQALMEQLRQQFQANIAERQGNRPQQEMGAGNKEGIRPPGGEGRMRPEAPILTEGNFGQRPADGEGRMGQEDLGGSGENARLKNARLKMARVFYLDEAGKLNMAGFVSGVTNGVLTEVVRSQQLREGLRVITGINTAQKDSEKKSTFSLPIPGFGGPPGGPPPR